MAIRYGEPFEFGDLNSVRDISAKEYLYEGMPGSGIKALNNLVSKNFSSDALEGLGQLKGVVLRVEDPDVKEPNSWDQRIELMRGAFSGEEPGSSTNAVQPRVRLKVRIPELHAAFPVPTELPEFSEINSNHGIIDLYPTFVSRTNNAIIPKPGDVVWVEFGNPLTQEDPVYLFPADGRSPTDDQIRPKPVLASYAFNQIELSEDKCTQKSFMGGDFTIPRPKGQNGPCGQPPCQDLKQTDWGNQIVKVAYAAIGYGEIIRDDTSPFNAMILDMYRRQSTSSLDCKEGRHSKSGNPSKYDDKSIFSEDRAWAKWTAWCNMFVNFCIQRAAYRLGVPMHITRKYYTADFSSKRMVKSIAQGGGKVIDIRGEWSPTQGEGTGDFTFKPENLDLLLPGDIAKFHKNNYKSNHIGIVESWDPQRKILTLIEGNLGPGGTAKVQRRFRHWSELHGSGSKQRLAHIIRMPELEERTSSGPTSLSDEERKTLETHGMLEKYLAKDIPTDAELWKGYEPLWEKYNNNPPPSLVKWGKENGKTQKTSANYAASNGPGPYEPTIDIAGVE